jgi:hypothetical protein
MATVRIQDGGATRSITIDGTEVSQYVTEYAMYQTLKSEFEVV